MQLPGGSKRVSLDRINTREVSLELGEPSNAPAFGAAFRFWLKLGFISFGGPTGQIAIMHEELVERRKWISEDRFLNALNYCMLLPGPEAQQLATYIGYLLHRTKGGIVAGVLFVLPSVFILLALSILYVYYGQAPLISAALFALKPAVLGIVCAAVIRIGKRALRSLFLWIVAAAAFLALFIFRVPFPVLILLAGVSGYLADRIFPRTTADTALTRSASKRRAHSGNVLRHAITVASIGLLVWWLPVFAFALVLGWNHVVVQEGLFFSKAAMVTFGGAYSILPYVSQQAVETHSWLSATQMLDGLGLAETTPGPLIMVLQFVGFVGGWNHPGALPPLASAICGALLTTWTTFVPSFICIFLGAPYIEELRENSTLASMLTAVTAAVVGVVINLAVWFGMHVLFPSSAAVDWFSLLIAALSFAAMTLLRWSVVLVVLSSLVIGIAMGVLNVI